MMNHFDIFMKSIRDGKLENVKEYFNVEFREKEGIFGMQPLYYACLNEREDIVKFLLEKGCKIETNFWAGWRPIHIVSRKGYDNIIETFIEHECELECKNLDHQTPMMLAKERSHIECIRIIGDAITMRRNTEILKEMSSKCRPDCDHSGCLKSLCLTEFRDGEIIGRGAFGKVYKRKVGKTDREFAIKSFNYVGHDSLNEDAQSLEIDINKYRDLIRHERIVQYFGAIKEEHKIYIFMEYYANGTIQDQLKNNGALKHPVIKRYINQTLQALKFLQEKNIIHRDVKPSNILLDDQENIKLTDFGYSRILHTIAKKSASCEPSLIMDSSTRTFCGTANYMAPEVILGQKYSFPCDIWSLGATCIAMLTGNDPLNQLEQNTVIFKIGTEKTLVFQPIEEMDEMFIKFLDLFLEPDQEKRGIAEGLLRHEIYAPVPR